MGLFDTVRSSFDIGPGYRNNLQTKDLACLMVEYWIDPVGKLYEIDYSYTADFVELGPDDPNYNHERKYLNFFWEPNGTKGTVRPIYHTGVVEVYPEKWDCYYAPFPSCHLTFVDGIITKVNHVNKHETRNP